MNNKKSTLRGAFLFGYVKIITYLCLSIKQSHLIYMEIKTNTVAINEINKFCKDIIGVALKTIEKLFKEKFSDKILLIYNIEEISYPLDYLLLTETFFVHKTNLENFLNLSCRKSSVYRIFKDNNDSLIITFMDDREKDIFVKDLGVTDIVKLLNYLNEI